MEQYADNGCHKLTQVFKAAQMSRLDACMAVATIYLVDHALEVTCMLRLFEDVERCMVANFAVYQGYYKTQ